MRFSNSHFDSIYSHLIQWSRPWSLCYLRSPAFSFPQTKYIKGASYFSNYIHLQHVSMAIPAPEVPANSVRAVGGRLPGGGRRQGIYWLLTLSSATWSPPDTLPSGLVFLRGQEEIGAGGFRHYQCVCAFQRKTGMPGVRGAFGASVHAELSRSAAASAYVWKEETAVEGRSA